MTTRVRYKFASFFTGEDQLKWELTYCNPEGYWISHLYKMNKRLAHWQIKSDEASLNVPVKKIFSQNKIVGIKRV